MTRVWFEVTTGRINNHTQLIPSLLKAGGYNAHVTRKSAGCAVFHLLFVEADQSAAFQ